MKLIILINTLEKLETEKSIILTKTAGTNNLQYIIRQISEAPGNLASVGTENRTKTRTKTRVGYVANEAVAPVPACD